MTEDPDIALAHVASAIAEPARSRMLCCLLDGHARTSTELAAVAGVGSPTASFHLQRMTKLALVQVTAQGRHRYYQLGGSAVAQALEALLVVANVRTPRFVPSTPPTLRLARCCYDHLAGEVGVAWHTRMLQMNWLVPSADSADYSLSAAGEHALTALGLKIDASTRRRYAYACMDWSMRRPHLGGALGAALLKLSLTRGWMRRQLDSRALTLTAKGRRELSVRFNLILGAE